MNGTLYGLGVGPGDPELLTLKAYRILQRVPVIAYPAPQGGESLVRAIAAPHIAEGKTEIVMEIAMAPGDFPAHGAYDRYARTLAGHLGEGRDVAVLCEGDPFFYGSFMYLYERLAGDYPARVVPGVSSLGACAAAAGLPLASRAQSVSILPAPLPEDELRRRLEACDSAAIIKVGRHLEKVRRVLAAAGLADSARYVERATMQDQKVLALDEVNGGAVPYFSMILVRKPDDR